MNHFHKKICYDKNENYKIVSDDLYKNGIFDSNDNEIANNIYRKVTIQDENRIEKYRKKNNDTRFQYGGNLNTKTDKEKYLIDMINNINIKDKLRLAICMSNSIYTNLKYDKPKMFEKFDSMLKEIDDEYKTTLINFAKYHLIMFAMAKIMEMTKEEQNQIALYLFNNINIYD